AHGATDEHRGRAFTPAPRSVAQRGATFPARLAMTPRIRTRRPLPCCLAARLALAPALAAAANSPSTTTPPLAAAANDRTVHAGEGAQLRLQVLLDRAHFSPGQIDGLAGSNQQRALRGFQQARGLEVTGEADAATWKA